MHEKTHLNKPCDRCGHYMILDLEKHLEHLKYCTASDKTLYENVYVSNIKESYNVLNDLSKVSIANAQLNGQHKESIFKQSILFNRDSTGEFIFDSRDGYPLWREDFCSPMYGDFSYNPTRNPTNDIRRSNVMHPSTFKAYSHDIFPIGSSVAIKFNKLLGLVEYSVQRFELNRWKEFNNSDLKLPRSKFPFKKNSDLPAFLQQFPDTYGINFDRGHLTPYNLACSIEDQREFQYQGNIFFQLSSQNRGTWKSLEMSIPKTMEAIRATVADITTAVVYARNKDRTFVTENGITKVQTYFKVIFYKNDSGKIIDINCFKINQYPTPDVTVSQVSLYDIDSIENNHYVFLNANLLKSIDSKILNIHKQPV
jgi:DNA/RNA endonuclease G (NUC1)